VTPIFYEVVTVFERNDIHFIVLLINTSSPVFIRNYAIKKPYPLIGGMYTVSRDFMHDEAGHELLGYVFTELRRVP